jgi:type IV pilus assembly protein PilB
VQQGHEAQLPGQDVAQAPQARRRRLGEVLVDAEVLTENELERALAAQAAETPRRKLGEIITGLELASETEIARALSSQLKLPFVALERLLAVPDATIRLLPRQVAVRHQAVPLSMDGGILAVAMGDPTNVVAIDDLRLVTRSTGVRAAVATLSDLREAVSRHYGGADGANQVLESIADMDDVELTESRLPADDEEDEDGNSAPVVRLVNAIFGEALHNRASDIHIEPQPRDVRVRMRIDGLLRERTVVPKQVQGALTSRIKILSGMDIAQRRKPQDGRGQVRVGELGADTRVSTMPTMHGETVVIRLLRKERQASGDLDSLGLGEEEQRIFLEAIGAPQGLVLITGPTGSGKTSTLYAALRHIHRPDVNILTLEDPVEYEMLGINQMQVDERIGLSFATGLRSALRQDPDVILVGEIRDPETASIAMQASMTGHLVLSTLHTNDAPSAVTRLVDMGVEPFLITASVSAVVAQRLARRPCDHCAEPVEATPDSLLRLGLTEDDVAGARLRHGVGCNACAKTGYQGRLALFEVMQVTRAVRDLVVARSAESAVRATALAEGMRSLRVDGLTKALEGLTTLEEVLRTTPAEVHGPAGPPGTGSAPRRGTVERRSPDGKGRAGDLPARRRSA